VKRVVGERVVVEADVFADGHDAVVAELLFRFHSEKEWQVLPMTFQGNDHWTASFPVERLGRYQYTVRGWTDPYLTWQRDLEKRKQAGQDLSVEMLIGKALEGRSNDARMKSYERVLEVVVDPVHARFSTWYELFPRSLGTLKDVTAFLPEVQALGFDVLYLPPIHPIGTTGRKGRNNTLHAAKEDVGSPWAIGAKEGGHKAIHPDLGGFEEFDELMKQARTRGIRVALDIAFQCSPDHPYLRERPAWFKRRPDGTVQYAENPPKKYQDIYPFDFESSDWKSLWEELKSIFEFWIERGVTIFRVDNPHTKSFDFWDWCISALKESHPEVVLLAEAFTRPRVMHKLAKLGYTQSYTYFTWRNTKQELVEYFSELNSYPGKEYFRPNVWPNTPDILHEYLQHGGRPAFEVRLILAATLAASYGIYSGYELAENTPFAAGSEEYLNSEKYELKMRDWNAPGNLGGLITRVNRIRREHRALQLYRNLRFHRSDDPNIVWYSKMTPALDDVVFVAVNLDAAGTHAGMVDVPIDELGLAIDQPYRMHELLSDVSYEWRGPRGFVELDPARDVAQIFVLRR